MKITTKKNLPKLRQAKVEIRRYVVSQTRFGIERKRDCSFADTATKTTVPSFLFPSFSSRSPSFLFLSRHRPARENASGRRWNGRKLPKSKDCSNIQKKKKKKKTLQMEAVLHQTTVVGEICFMSAKIVYHACSNEKAQKSSERCCRFPSTQVALYKGAAE